MKKWKQISLMAVSFCVIVIAGMMIGKTVHAASGYERLLSDEYYGEKIPQKQGKYYFKYVKNKVYMSKKKQGGYKVTPLEYESFTNGKQAYYVKNNILYKYKFSNRKKTKIKKFPAKKDYYYTIAMIYGNRIFLTKTSYNEWRCWTYQYNIKSKKLKMLQKDCEIAFRHGKYVVASNAFSTDVSPGPYTLYKITSSGLKKIKKYTNNGFSNRIIDGKLYYTEYKNYSMRKVTLYRCDLNCKRKKALGTFTAASGYDGIYFQEITSKKCIIRMNEELYEYTYATKKLKKKK